MKLFLFTLISFLSVWTFGQEQITNITETKSELSYSPEQEYFFNIIKSRRSVRRFLPTPIPDEHLTRILEMASYAPSAGNQQGWKFLVIKNRDKINDLKNAVAEKYLEYSNPKKEMTDSQIAETKVKISNTLDGYLSAPVFIVVLTDSNSMYPSYNIKDGVLAAENLILAARALGYGSVFGTDSFPFDIVKKVFEIPSNYEIICTIPVGIPEKWPDSPKKKSLNEVIVYEKF